MRLALLGPAEGNVDALQAAARFVLERQAVDRVVYLGVDGALDAVIAKWATELVGGDASEDGVFVRAAQRCLEASAAEIDQYIAAERARARLRVFESLPEPDTRVIEMLAGALVVMIHDKALLDEEDMLPARVLIFGKSTQGLVKQVGQRWFLAPGPFPEGGLMTLEDADDGILLTSFDGAQRLLRSERLSIARGAKMKVSGADA